MSAPRLILALAQVNPDGGRRRGQRAHDQRRDKARLASGRRTWSSSRELCLPGYPAEDLYLKRHFLEAQRTRDRVPRRPTPRGSPAVIGFAEPLRNETIRRPDGPYQRGGGELTRRPARRDRGRDLSQDEPARTTRSSTSAATSSRAPRPMTIEVEGVRVGLTICEDIWEPGPPASGEAEAGARSDHQPVRLALRRAASRPSARQMIAERARPTGPLRLLQPGRRPGRTRLRRRQLRRGRRGQTSWPGRRASARSC